MNFIDVVNKRQSIRRFKEIDVPNCDIREIIESVSKAPSATNVQNWYFVAIKDKLTKTRIGEVIKNKNELIARAIEESDQEAADKFRKFCNRFTLFPTTSPVLFVVLTKEYIPMEKKLLDKTDLEFSDSLIHQLKYMQNPGMQSLGAALNTFGLAAVDKGYGSCWLTSANYASEEVLEVIEGRGVTTNGFFLGGLLALGVPEEGAKSPTKKHVDEILTILD